MKGFTIFFIFLTPLKKKIYIIYKCSCKHLLAISKLLEALEHPCQSYGAFCPCYFTYLDSKLEGTHTVKANGKGKFCSTIKGYCLYPEAHLPLNGSQISCWVISWPLRRGHEYIALQSPCIRFFEYEHILPFQTQTFHCQLWLLISTNLIFKKFWRS